MSSKAGIAARYNPRMIAGDIVAAIHARLAHALATPGAGFMPFLVGPHVVGWLDPARAAALAAQRDALDVRTDGVRFAAGIATSAERTAALGRVAAQLAAAGGLTAWRDERYAVAPVLGAEPLFLLERAAARYFGVCTYAVHVNGLVQGGDGPAMWIARRSPRKSIDPGLLDNLVGGGIAAGTSVRQTLVKEAWEEAGIPASLAAQSRAAGAVHICRTQPDGLQRESIFVHDLPLPADFVPAGQDGEVVEHRLVSLAEAARLVANVAGDDVVTADAGLVIMDCLIRQGMVAPDAPEFLALEALRHPSVERIA